jgi:hypothetical protein
MFSGPPPYSDIVLPVPAIKPASTFATGSQATITLAADEVPKRKQSAPASYSIPQSQAAIDAARCYPSPESSLESPLTPASSQSPPPPSQLDHRLRSPWLLTRSPNASNSTLASSHLSTSSFAKLRTPDRLEEANAKIAHTKTNIYVRLLRRRLCLSSPAAHP